MTSMIAWMVALTLSLCLTVLSAAAARPDLHLVATSVVSLAIAIAAVRAERGLAGPAVRSARAALIARYCAMSWIWAGVAIFVTYDFILQGWPEWWQFSLGLLLVGGLSLMLASVLTRDADAGRDDDSLLKMAKLLNILQVVGMVLAMFGLVADHKFGAGLAISHADWAANNILFFGAFAIMCIGASGLILDAKAKS